MAEAQANQSITQGLEALVTSLVLEGTLTDELTARRRIKLGYPAWLVLEELGTERLLPELSRFSNIPILEYPLADAGIDLAACEAYGPRRLQEIRCLPLTDGRVALADPFKTRPDGELAGRPLCLAPYTEIDAAFEENFPWLARQARQRRRMGRYLMEAGAISEQDLADALDEQSRNGGRLGEILISHGIVTPAAMSSAIASHIGLAPMRKGSQPIALLSSEVAHGLRAVALETEDHPNPLTPIKVAFTDPTDEAVAEVSAILGRPVEPQVTDDETLDALLISLYAEQDIKDVVDHLAAQRPYLSAYRTGLSRPQTLIAAVLGLILLTGLVLMTKLTAILVVGAGTSAYVLYTLYRLYSAWRGWSAESIINPTKAQLDELEGRDLPAYTILLPAFKEKPTTLRVLIDALTNLDYPKQKINALLLVEADDQQTQDALASLWAPDEHRPTWLKTLLIPPGEPRTKPKAMIYALLYATGDLLTIFDAEDKPDPDQLKKAAWAFKHAAPNTACIQAKLSYFNSRQNLLTRWFTLEYAAWFDLFLPGLHSMGAPIPLGGTSNHFRLSVLKEVLSWDPYNVTEDADLGLRFTRAGYRTLMLESTTYEEANSKYKNWLRQRSRWIKGYMQTFLVHTRHPRTLYRELGLVNSIHFMATVGGLIYTVLASPLFWSLLALWVLFQPGWIPELFPGPIYYMAMASLVFGNFFFIFLALIGAVGRGQDDLAPVTLIVPIYWMMMSIAAYLALYELIRKPHYWQKTEHGLHFQAMEAKLLDGPSAEHQTLSDAA